MAELILLLPGGLKAFRPIGLVLAVISPSLCDLISKGDCKKNVIVAYVLVLDRFTLGDDPLLLWPHWRVARTYDEPAGICGDFCTAQVRRSLMIGLVISTCTAKPIWSKASAEVCYKCWVSS